MKNKIDVQTFRFMGDSSENKAVRLENVGKKREITGRYTQTAVIRTLNECRDKILGGRRVKLKLDDREIYEIDLGSNPEKIEQIIKIIIPSESLKNGDPNALAIQNLCKYSIEVKKSNVKANVALAIVTIGVVVATIVGFVDAEKKEAEEIAKNIPPSPVAPLDYDKAYDPDKEVEAKYIQSYYSSLEASNDEYSGSKSY